MNCNNNGKTTVVSLTTIPGGTPANANFQLELTHYTCGNRKLCTQNEVFPVSADLKATPLGLPVSLGNNIYCQEVLISGNVTYMPYNCGCGCNACPRTEGLYTTICVPCSSAASPTLTIGESVAVPTGVQPCNNITNAIAITTSLNVTTGA